jgi:hypothetical protein
VLKFKVHFVNMGANRTENVDTAVMFLEPILPTPCICLSCVFGTVNSNCFL